MEEERRHGHFSNSLFCGLHWIRNWLDTLRVLLG